MATPSRSTGGPSVPSHYALLRLPVTASPQELRTAFRTLSKLYHPDTTELPLAQAEVAFRRLQQAYAVLSDPSSRRAYDQLLNLTPRPQDSTAPPPRRAIVSRPVPERRALSGGEWFALLLLAIALVLSLVLGVGLAWARGAELIRRPTWWADLHPADRQVPPVAPDTDTVRMEPPLAAPGQEPSSRLPPLSG
jgi:hypothetical protein